MSSLWTITNALNSCIHGIDALAMNPYASASLSMVMNAGLASMGLEMQPLAQRLQRSKWLRRLVILITYFLGTRSFKVALVLTLLTIVALDVLLNPDHPWSMLSPAAPGVGTPPPPPPPPPAAREPFRNANPRTTTTPTATPTPTTTGSPRTEHARMARFMRSYRAY